ncbi:1-phosphatidylinositol-3-phosphate 5-kinase FAB1B isoform X2 [Diospyros lotus]|uniref:1-phosphatidylinositol-3-phosphate 5-kinase FAB1B isoform X2 n=1 Tax=Diospyros lotus TaxID=55363 RepID=UPI0022596CBF|nr:1-phosphatidylinositol-3-phosphate 5-kinase FAB1B isoform X2 [Diospyros lotus]
MGSSHNRKLPDLGGVRKSWANWRNAEPACMSSRDFWMPDQSCRVCYECDSQFTIFNRRHHCRLCGRVFCAKCTSNSVPVSSDENRTSGGDCERIRVCSYCFKQREQGTAVAGTEMNASSPGHNLSPSSTPSLSPSPSSASLVSTHSSCTYYSSGSSISSTQNSTAPHNLLLYTGNNSHRESPQMNPDRVRQGPLTSQGSSNSIAGGGDPFLSKFNFPINSDDEDDEYGTRGTHSDMGNFPQSDNYYGAVSYDRTDHLYGPHEVRADGKNIDTECRTYSISPGSSGTQELEGFVKVGEEVVSCKNDEKYKVSPIYSADSKDSVLVDFENNALLWLPPDPEYQEDERDAVSFDEEEDAVGELGYPHTSSSFSSRQFHNKDRSSEEHRKAMKNVVDGHFRTLVEQLLHVENVSLSVEENKENWLDIITSLSWEAATLLKPDTSEGGRMDPGGYVKVKCIACGCPSDSMVVKGVVCKKNVAHRRMASKIDKPRLLILGGALEYQRVSNHLSSFDTLLQQEMDHLKMAVAKIDAHHPNVLLVEKSVSRYAQEYLLERNISVVLNLKRPLLERIARCTGAQIAPSVDHLTSQKLGYCNSFHVEKFLEEHGSAGQIGKKLTKTLMFFEGCPKPLGCTILLKGASGDELKNVKHILQYGVFAAYNLALETSFLADEGASLPELPLKSPISVALPENPPSIGRSISIIPGINASETGKPQETCALSASQIPNNLSALTSAATFPPQWKSDMELSACLSQSHTSQTLHSGPPMTVVKLAASHDSICPGHDFSDVCQKLPSTYHATEESSKVGLEERLNGNFWEVLGEDNISYNHFSTSEGMEQGVGGCHSNGNLFPANCLSASNFASLAIEGNTNSGEVGSLREELSPLPSDHRSILVSLTTRCVWKGTVCERAHLFRIKYYGSFDKPLGRFLQDHLLDQSYRCPSCEMPSEAHVHSYTHQQGSLTISVKKLQQFILPGEREGKIWMWHRCLQCPRMNGFPPATRRVVMSDAAWGLSFGKFLELSFSNHAAASRVANCGHSLHRDSLRFYGSGRMVACFRYTTIQIHSVHLPCPKLEFNFNNQEWIKKEVNEVRSNKDLLFSEVHNALFQISEQILHDSSMKAPESRSRVAELEEILQKEKEELEMLLQQELNRKGKLGHPIIDILEINKLRRQLIFHSYVWDQRLIYSLCSDSNKVHSLSNLTAKLKEKYVSSIDRPVEILQDAKIDTINHHGKVCMLNKPNEIPKGKNKDGDLNCRKEAAENIFFSENMENELDNPESGRNPRRALSEGQFSMGTNLSGTLDSTWSGENHPRIITPKDNGHRHPNKVVADSSIEVDTFAANSDLENCTNGHDGANVAHSPASSFSFEEPRNSMCWVGMPFFNFYYLLNTDSLLCGQIISKVNKYNPVYIMSFRKLVCQGGARLLLPVGFNDIVVPVYDDEPTSIISYALVSADYHTQISKEPEKPKDGIESSFSLPLLDSFSLPLLDSPNLLSLHSFDEISAESFRSLKSTDESIFYTPGSQSSVLEALLFTKTLHARVSFTDDGPLGKVKYTVTCYYAKKFEDLRRNCCPSELDFIRSLSHCRKWGAQGGKSNVFFAKTLDDRFIIKQVTKTELESFIKFAPAYFNYLSESIRSGGPTCLAKILGIYQVSSKYLKGGKESKMDVLVMENLLFGRNITRLYDLKGSSRSRYNPDSSGSNKVLLDQNLIEAIPTSPIFVGNKAKRLLERAVWNDTSFLAAIDVMDYSLLVGVDEEKNELVVGIIDFMRQYTWDKHLETWVKASGILGGPKNTPPTVISPKQYKKRFRKAMSSYFLVVPDQWSPTDLCQENSRS